MGICSLPHYKSEVGSLLDKLEEYVCRMLEEYVCRYRFVETDKNVVFQNKKSSYFINFIGTNIAN